MLPWRFHDRGVTSRNCSSSHAFLAQLDSCLQWLLSGSQSFLVVAVFLFRFVIAPLHRSPFSAGLHTATDRIASISTNPVVDESSQCFGLLQRC